MINEQIEVTEEMLANTNIGSDEYYNYLEVLSKLYKLRDSDLERLKIENSKESILDKCSKIITPILPVIVAGVFGLVRTNKILKYEELDVITTKSFNLPKD